MAQHVQAQFCDSFFCFQTGYVVLCCHAREGHLPLLFWSNLLHSARAFPGKQHTSELMAVPFFIMSTRITPFMSQKTPTITSPSKGTVLMFFHGEFM